MSGVGILALNIGRPGKDRARRLLEYLWAREEEVLVLSEVGPGEGSDLVAAVCRAAGYSVLDSRPRGSGGRSAYGLLVVGRGVTVARDDEVPALALLPERMLPCRVGVVRVLGVYGAASDPVRHASRERRQRKRDWLDGFLATLADLEPASGLLVGDLNVVAPGHRDELRFVLEEERSAYARLTGPLGLVDVVARDLDPAEVTWVDHTGAGCRYDHALATPDLADRIRGVALDHAPREQGWTDHSAVRLELAGESAALRAGPAT